jgi:hypothetical protein
LQLGFARECCVQSREVDVFFGLFHGLTLHLDVPRSPSIVIGSYFHLDLDTKLNTL